MKIVKPTQLGLLTRPFRYRGAERLGIGVLALATMEQSAKLLSESALWTLAAEAVAPATLDIAVPKARAEFLVSAHAYGCYSDERHMCTVTARVAALEKQLNVWGERYWRGQREHLGAADFIQIPLDWRHTYGGRDYPENPSGMGAKSVSVDLWPVPHVEYPARAQSTRRMAGIPASFAPIPPNWPQRQRFFGKPDRIWMERDWPGFPADIDWRYFNAAPLDQQFPGQAELPPDAAYAFTHMHPKLPQVEGCLPGLLGRCFVQRRGTPGLEEVPLRLTTAWFVPAQERVILIFHGDVELAQFDATDLEAILVAAERQHQRRHIEHYQQVFAQRLDKAQGVLHALRDSDLVPIELVEDVPVADVLPGRFRHQQFAFAQHQVDVVAREAQRADRMDVQNLLPVPPAISPQAPLSPEQMVELVESQERMATAAAAQALMAKERAERAQQDALTRADEHGVQLATAGEKREGASGGAPSSIHARLESLPEFSSRVADSEALLDQAEQADRKLNAAYRRTAQYQPAPDRLDDARQRELRAKVADLLAGGRELQELDLTGADLRGLDFRGARLCGCLLENSLLADCHFEQARLRDCTLVRADLRHAVFAGAELHEVNLAKACCEGANFDRATLVHCDFEQAELANFSAQGARLEGGRFTNCDLQAVDLSEAVLKRLIFIEQALRQICLRGATIEKWILLRCQVEDLDLSGADIEGLGVVDTQTVGEISFRKARLRKACFVGDSGLERADFSEASLSEVNLRDGRFRGARFHRATFSRCDLSGADMRETDLRGIKVDAGFMIRTDLRLACLRGADLIGGSLRQARFEGADLRDANLFRANLTQISLDRQTRMEGAYLQKAMLFPQAAEGSGQ